MGSEGVNRQEGSQTLQAERSGRWHRPRLVDFRTCHVLKGAKAQESCLSISVDGRGVLSQTLEERETRREDALAA
jgi:hypothetical protein